MGTEASMVIIFALVLAMASWIKAGIDYDADYDAQD